MLRRTPSTPAASIASSTPGSRDAGPIVAKIFAFLTIDVHCRPFWPAPLSNDVGNHGRHSARVFLELFAEGLAQQGSLSPDANRSADTEYYQTDRQTYPMTDG